jgi:arabinose-5-phosphate isomerase
VKNIEQIKKTAVETIETEQSAIAKLVDFIDNDFALSVELIYQSKGRVIVTGIGKSAIIAQKLVATFNSTGTPSIFMHAADAIHGDLGMIQPDDVVICTSKSGNTPEIKVLIPLVKNFGNKIIALVSNVDSFLAKQADFVIRATVEKEACPNNLAPTSSTTTQLVMGDALAVCLLECRSFSGDDFARFHPGGALGKQLYLRVNDLYKQNASPKVHAKDNVNDVIIEISSKRLGATAVLDEREKLIGIITDGDLRRMLQKGLLPGETTAEQIMSKNPKTVAADLLAVNAFDMMKKNNITQLAVCENDIYLGIIHLHDILREGIV